MKITKTLPLLALMAACTTITAQGPVSVTRTDDCALKALSWTAMQCVYTLAKVENDGKTFRSRMRAMLFRTVTYKFLPTLMLLLEECRATMVGHHSSHQSNRSCVASMKRELLK